MTRNALLATVETPSPEATEELIVLTLVRTQAEARRCCDLLAASEIPALVGDGGSDGLPPADFAVLVPASAAELAGHMLATREAMAPVDDDEDEVWDDDDDDDDEEFEDDEDDEFYLDDDDDDFEEEEFEEEE